MKTQDRTPTLEESRRRPLGRTGLKVSPLGFGGGPIGVQHEDRETTARVLHELLDRGVNVIDTAPCYEDSEDLIGATVADRRDEFVLVTKCGHRVDVGDPPAEPEWSPEVIRHSIERSLRRLRTDRLDAVILHSCDLETLRRGDALGALVEARDAGKVRFVGYSGDNEAAAYAAGLDDVAIIETSLNVCDQANLERVLPTARARNVGVIVKRPVANAAWRTPEEQPGFYKEYASDYHRRLAAMDLKPEDVGFSSEADWPEIALRFALSFEGAHTAIAGTTDPRHAASNLEHAAKGPLPEDAIRTIRDAFENASEGGWEGLT